MPNPPFVPPPLNFDLLNEADVRAEFLDPLLKSLGYQAGTENNIIREGLLRHKFLFLGRKKPTDPPLAGKPDYVMECGSHGRWVLEAKPPSQALTREEFEQAQSYALHANVAAALFVLSNGREIRVYRTIDQDFQQPLLAVPYDAVAEQWLELEAILSPVGFRRHFPAPTWNPGLPIARGFGASIRLGTGEAVPGHVATNLQGVGDQLGALANLTNHIARGRCWRDAGGRIQTECEFRSSSAAVQRWLQEKNISSMSLGTDDQFISLERSDPTLMSGWMSVSISAGEQMFDISTWKLVTIPFSMTVESLVSAAVHIDGDRVLGDYSLMLTARLPMLPEAVMIEQVGSVALEIIQ